MGSAASTARRSATRGFFLFIIAAGSAGDGRVQHLPDTRVATRGGQHDRRHPRRRLNLFAGRRSWQRWLATSAGSYGATSRCGCAVIMALSGTLLARWVRVDMVSPRRRSASGGSRSMKLAAHVTILGLTMAVLAVASVVASTLRTRVSATRFRLGFALWGRALIALCFGGLAFALGPVLGRLAAGVSGGRRRSCGRPAARRVGPGGTEPVPLDGEPHRARGAGWPGRGHCRAPGARDHASRPSGSPPGWAGAPGLDPRRPWARAAFGDQLPRAGSMGIGLADGAR